MNTQTQITEHRPSRVFVRKKSETPKGAVFIGPKSEWWPKQIDEGGTPEYRREVYRQSLMASRKWQARIKIRQQLRGKDIASTCPQWQVSFVDVLLEIANGTE
jgi:hypothetical protein